jgi:hypothetical protein
MASYINSLAFVEDCMSENVFRLMLIKYPMPCTSITTDAGVSVCISPLI